jgi:hypothetical protein
VQAGLELPAPCVAPERLLHRDAVPSPVLLLAVPALDATTPVALASGTGTGLSILVPGEDDAAGASR